MNSRVSEIVRRAKWIGIVLAATVGLLLVSWVLTAPLYSAAWWLLGVIIGDPPRMTLSDAFISSYLNVVWFIGSLIVATLFLAAWRALKQSRLAGVVVLLGALAAVLALKTLAWALDPVSYSDWNLIPLAAWAVAALVEFALIRRSERGRTVAPDAEPDRPARTA